MSRDLRIVVVGAGFGGFDAAIELRRHGLRDVTIVDRADGIGGTWLHNTYPGASCDVPSHLYSYSFAQRRDWPRLCSPQEEILRYLREVARDHGVDGCVLPSTEIATCAWDDVACRWALTTAEGRAWDADAIVIATGQLHRPAVPRIEGRETFAGHAFHSAEWDHGYDLRGKRVGVVGTGASSVQFVPEIAEQVEHLAVFQRTGNWFLSRKNRPYPRLVAALIRRVPGVQALRRAFTFYYAETLTLMIRYPRTWGRLGRLRSTVFLRWLRDPELRRKAWPGYTFGCKRILFSSYYLRALARPNVELVSERIERITPAGLVTADGREHALDCIVYATGFRANDFMFPLEVTGVGGRTLREAWADGAHAHLGMTIPGFPSLFVMYGPNTNTGTRRDASSPTGRATCGSTCGARERWTRMSTAWCRYPSASRPRSDAGTGAGSRAKAGGSSPRYQLKIASTSTCRPRTRITPVSTRGGRVGIRRWSAYVILKSRRCLALKSA